jgi:hypothetical protein
MTGTKPSALAIRGEKVLTLLADMKSDLAGLNSRIDALLEDVRETRQTLASFQASCYATRQEIETRFSFQNGEKAGKENVSRWAQAKIGMIVGIVGVIAMLLQYYAMR